MLFSSLVFIWMFLPLVLFLSRILPKAAQNGLLLFASLFFYAWGEPKNIVLMLFSITANWLFAIGIEKQKENQKIKKLLVVAAVILNLGLLGYFKYAGFALKSINRIFGTALTSGVALPIGISFYTFQALSYVIDCYRGQTPAQKSWFKVALYISFFPQLIAGPIVQYSDVARQLETRETTWEGTAYGIKRFIYGLAKKVILANSFAAVADSIFAVNPKELYLQTVWLGAVLYALQIYYDFSGYSDMAIGLGRMFGFEFKENFNYPYISKSCTEFWRRWHISLSSWFRDYLYIPLGGNRKGKGRTYVNLFIVFFCTGLWHGANWQFVAWGLYYGVILIIERIFLKKWLDKLPILNRIYTIAAVLFGWVIFRAAGLRQAIITIKTMLVPQSGIGAYPAVRYLDMRITVLIVVGILLCGVLQSAVPSLKIALFNEEKIYLAEAAVLIILLFICTMLLVAGTYNPFIYFRF